jgi:DNA (cytosine-5)-methyltransferase 1
MVKAVDLFCGAGGLTKGLEKAGIDVELGVDIDPDCIYPYEANNNARFLLKSVEHLKSEDLFSSKGKKTMRLLAGCAPCQPFSGYRKGIDSKSDKRWRLLREFKRLIEETSPEFVTMENVPRLQEEKVFFEFVKSLEKNGYHTSYSIVRCADYGIPQQRQRLVLLASKLGPINLIPPTHSPKRHKTVADAIGDLPRIKAGGSCRKDPLHTSRNLTPINLKRIRSSVPGGTWRDWNKKLVTECHKKKSGTTYPSVYGRMDWDKPAPTMTTQFFGFGNGRFGHPTQDRAISLREGAIIQTFPKNYKFVEPTKEISFERLGRLIGNAVPVRLGEVIGKSIKLHIQEVKRAR